MAAALTALLIFAWGRRIGGERARAGGRRSFSPFAFKLSSTRKAAVADMWLVFFVTAAHWAGYELLRDRPRMLDAIAKWLGGFSTSRSASAFLAKGPIGWTPLLTVAATKFFLPRSKLNRRFHFLAGCAVSLAIVSLWGIPALVQTNGEFLRVGIGHHVVERSVVAMEGHGGGSILGYLAALPFYFVAIFLTFFPWSIQTPLARRRHFGASAIRSTIISSREPPIIFIIFTLVKTKLPHYTLPAFPLLALLLAKALVRQDGAERIR